MLYKPTFCCECGNKIERTQWLPWTSRRFCENCEADFRKEDWLPKILPAVVMLLSGLFVFGNYLKTPEKPLSVTSGRVTNYPADSPKSKSGQENANAGSAKITQQDSPSNVDRNIVQNNASSAQVALKAQALQNNADEPVYFCGAQTKKGNPCGRKVKGGGRCWQHIGQPSMLPKGKLVAAQ